MNNLTAFSVKPLRLDTTCGVLCALIGVIMALYTIIHKLLNPAVAAGYSSMMAVILFLGGA